MCTSFGNACVRPRWYVHEVGTCTSKRPEVSIPVRTSDGGGELYYRSRAHPAALAPHYARYISDGQPCTLGARFGKRGAELLQIQWGFRARSWPHKTERRIVATSFRNVMS